MSDGFSLIELIVVIAVLAILIAIVMPAYSGYIMRAEEAVVEAELADLVTAVHIAEVLCHTEVAVVTVDEGGQVCCFVAAEYDSEGTIMSFHEFDISDIHSGAVEKIGDHRAFRNGCTWLRTEQNWHAGVDETEIFGTNPPDESN